MQYSVQCCRVERGLLGWDFLNCQWDVIIITSGAEFLMSMNSFDSSSLVCLFLALPAGPTAAAGSRPRAALDPVDMAVTIVVPVDGTVVM